MAEIALLPFTAGPSKIQPQSLPSELDQVVRLVDAKPESLARGDAEMYAAALAATKMIYGLALDTEKSAAKPISKLLRGLTPGDDAPTTRAQKRKREDVAKPPPLTFRPTPKAGRLAGADASWNAAKLWEHMEYRAAPLCGILEAVVAPEDIIEEEEEEEETEEELEAGESGEVAFDDDEDGADYSMSEEDDDEDEEDEEEDESESDDESDGGESHLGETTMELSRGEDHSGSSDEEEDDDNDEEATNGGYLDGLDLDREENPQKAAKKRAHPTLDDGFFSTDAFNRETEALEAQSRSTGALNDDDDEDEEDVDLFLNVEDVEDDEDDVNDPQYKDFFAPPPKPKKAAKSNPAPQPGSPSKSKRKLKLLVASPPKRSTIVRFNEEVRVRKIKSKRTRASLLAELAEAEEDEEEVEEGEEGAWTSEMLDGSEGSEEESDDGSEESEEEGEKGGKAKGDLFAEDEPTDESGTTLSSYQQRLADLSAEIKALEAENVAPKPWTLQGEATARSRPQNALLSADLEFEHVGKVVPIVTEETVKKLEDRIKARITEGRYDDVVRKRETDAKPFLPSRMFELKDTQSEKSLAQIYEDEYTASRAGPSTGPVDDRDGKLAQEHKDVEELWDGICYKLDALSNAHFTPKQPKAQITTVSNIASASLESALPTSLSTSTLLAPEEVYAPAAGDARAKGELTPGEKRAARTKERKKRRKQRDALSGAVDKFGANGAVGRRGAPRNVKEAKNQALKGLVKNGKGVTVVGKDSAKAAGRGKGIKETSAKSKDAGPARDSKKFKL